MTPMAMLTTLIRQERRLGPLQEPAELHDYCMDGGIRHRRDT